MTHTPFYVVAIGLAAGGYGPLFEFMARLPPKPGIAIVVIHHFDQVDHQSIDTRLAEQTNMAIHWARDKQQLKADHIYLLPANKTMTIHKGCLSVRDQPNSGQLESVINIFFQSLAKDQKALAIGVVLSGIGPDGTPGVIEIHQQGGIVLVQDPDSALFASMPQSAILRDHPDRVLAPSQLADALLVLVKNKP